MEINPTLLRLAMGVPFAGAGGLIGLATGPRDHKMESMARGAGMGYMTGTGLGAGMQLGTMAKPDDTNDALPYQVAGGVGGAARGLGVGKMMQGEPKWEERRKFREELLAVLREEQAKRYGELQKFGSDEEHRIARYAREYPEATLMPIMATLGSMTAVNTKRPFADKVRGAARGLGIGASATLGATLGKNVASDPTAGVVGGGTLGGLLGYLAMRKLLPDYEKQGASPLQILLQAKQLSDQKDYHGKHQRLRMLMDRYPDDFFVDSVNNDIAGITHRPTNFKVHVPIRVLPNKLRGSAQTSQAKPKGVSDVLTALAG